MHEQKQSLVQRLAARRRRQITIALDDNPDRYLREEVMRRGWKLLNLWYCGGKPVPWITCQGAILRCPPDNVLSQTLQATGCRIVRLGTLPHPMDDRIPAILPDLAAYGRRAAEHFHERRFKHVACIVRDPWGDMQPLYEGFSQRAEELGMTCHILRFKATPASNDETLAARYLRRQKKLAAWLATVPNPLGMLAHCDFSAAELCFMIAQAGFDVPTDIAVLSRGSNKNICSNAMPPISSFEDNLPDLFHGACDLLARMLAGETPPAKPLMIPPRQIIERQSTHVMAVNHPVVARALRFIWDHYTEPLTSADVAEAVSISRSVLYRLFSRHFARTVKAELNRKRLTRCRELLENTRMSMPQIAAACGFSSAAYMREAFRSAYATSPRQYRADHADSSG